MKELIIETPSLQTLRQRYTHAIVTLVFWIIFLYLWIPLASLMAWLMGIGTFYEEIVVQEGYYQLLNLFFWYGVTILVISVVFLGWALYNQFRFRGKDRRRHPTPPTIEDLANYFQVDLSLLGKGQKARRIVVRHNEEGNILGMDM